MIGDPTVVGAVASGSTMALLTVPLIERWTRVPRRRLEPSPTEIDEPVSPTRSPGDATRRRWRGKQRRATPQDLGAWLDQVARATRTGRGLSEALMVDDDPAVRHDVEPLRRRLRSGASIGEAARRWRDELNGAGDALTVAASALVVAYEVGGSTAVPLERAAALLRARAAEADERAGWSAQARLSARVMALLPLAVLGVLGLADEGVIDVLTSPAGAVLLGVGLALDGIGFFWMRRIVRRAAP